ncbi:MAG: hypothetical protein HRU12_02745 [Phaeodactylibacter sp.]|nr:hypothetical protein [Phaeodactylibacter sp.]
MSDYVKQDLVDLVADYHTDPSAGKYFCSWENLQKFKGRSATAIPNAINFGLNGTMPKAKFSKENAGLMSYNGQSVNGAEVAPKYVLLFEHRIDFTIKPVDKMAFPIDDMDNVQQYVPASDLVVYQVMWPNMFGGKVGWGLR